MNKIIRPLLLALALLAAPLSSQAGVFISVNIAPPALPVYEQPMAPGDGYIWTPGYWSWDPDQADYYWVPGTWVLAPEPGYLWTPGYWGWENDVYLWHGGYWGPHVGFYGGVNYGYGYNGDGFHGGEWRNGAFFYNRSVSNINVVNIHNTYNERVVERGGGNRVSFNGGHGGIAARENEQQRNWANERHVEATSVQERNRDAARGDRSQFAKANQGRPAVFATSRAGEFKGQGVVSHGQAAPFHPANGAYNKGGQPGGAGAQRGAPAYVQHQREAEGQQHTMIQPQQQREQQQRTQQVQQQREQQQQRSQQVQQQRQQQQQRSQQVQQRSQQMQQQHEQQQQRAQQMQQRAQPQPRAQPMQQPHEQQAPHPQGGQPHGGEPHQEHH